MINSKLMPTGKKAFTLAEVLITLSILGVVAALTIPSLVNRNQDVVALTKVKKAVAVYEAAVQNAMVESNRNDGALLLRDTPIAENNAGVNDNLCTNAGKYFKIVSQYPKKNCVFTTSDGVYWSFNPNRGYALVYDSETNPRYGVYLYNMDGRINDQYAIAENLKYDKDGNEIQGVKYNPWTPTRASDGSTAFRAPAYGYFTSKEIMALANKGLTRRKNNTQYDSLENLTKQVVRDAQQVAADNAAADQANQGGN